MTTSVRAPLYAAFAAAMTFASSAHAGRGDPSGIWFDHEGRSAIEIKECDSGAGYCGHAIHIRKAGDMAKGCGRQILFNVTDDSGEIFSPSRNRRFDVQLTRISEDKLRVVGNSSSRFFSRTFTWERAPDDIERCGEQQAAAKPKAVKKAKVKETEDEGEGIETTTETTAATDEAEETKPAPKSKKKGKATEKLPPARTGAGALLALADTKHTEEPATEADEPVKPVKKAKKAKKKKDVEPEAETAADDTAKTETEPETTAETKDETKKDETKKGKKTVELADDESIKDSGSSGGNGKFAELIDKFMSGKGKGGKCKYKIPYIGRTVTGPCR